MAGDNPKMVGSSEVPLSVLLIDDDKELCRMMKEFFVESGYRLHYENDGQRGLIAAASGVYDLLILDVMLPGFDGFTVLDHVRRRSNLPILMLTARAQRRDRIHGLNAGADDYLLKPFDPDELLARIRAVLRRTSAPPAHSLVRQIGDLNIDFSSRAVRRGETNVGLTEMEFNLLEVLARSAGRIVLREELALILFERQPAHHDRILDVHISNLRKKLGGGRDLIRTVRGVGYVFGHAA